MLSNINLVAVEGRASQWRDDAGNLYIGRANQTLADLVAELNTPPSAADVAARTAAATQARFASAIQSMLDTKARERGYDSIATAVSYRDDPNAQYKAEGEALFNWRSAVWTYAYAQLAAVTAGTRTQPSVEDFVTEIGTHCPFEWTVT